jgi:hypothetical protein
MSEIHIKLQRNKESHDWSLEINGRLHEHVSDEGLTDVVEGALIVAAKTLIVTSDSTRAPEGEANTFLQQAQRRKTGRFAR